MCGGLRNNPVHDKRKVEVKQISFKNVRSGEKKSKGIYQNLQVAASKLLFTCCWFFANGKPYSISARPSRTTLRPGVFFRLYFTPILSLAFDLVLSAWYRRTLHQTNALCRYACKTTFSLKHILKFSCCTVSSEYSKTKNIFEVNRNFHS